MSHRYDFFFFLRLSFGSRDFETKGSDLNLLMIHDLFNIDYSLLAK